MAFDEAWLELVPPARDAEFLNDQLARQTFSAAQQELSDLGIPLQLNCLYWTLRLAEEWQQLASLASRVPFLDRITAGFFDPEIDNRDPAFGVIFYSNTPEETDLEIPDFGNAGIDAGPYFPAIARMGARVPQVSITGPSIALATTWARSTRSKNGGWLVPAHALLPGQIVTFSDGSSGTASESWGDCIDASLVTPNQGPPPGVGRRSAVRGVSQGLTVSAIDRAGRPHSTTIVDVDLNLGVVKHALFPIRFSYDWRTSVQGDSGALVIATPCGEPIGMHQGMFKPNPAYGSPANQLAYALCLYQLEDYGGLEIYQ